ncbi:hypothetical protein PVT71_14655 [Salipiger sp. H15]|uniref:Uncharacterized protein n=1 Tax=Alloyangia sp. H15 TaxID=3029062 RepID=A0AAU8ALV1_9RHOB
MTPRDYEIGAFEMHASSPRNVPEIFILSKQVGAARCPFKGFAATIRIPAPLTPGHSAGRGSSSLVPPALHPITTIH